MTCAPGAARTPDAIPAFVSGGSICPIVGHKQLFATYRFERVVHLAAQAGSTRWRIRLAQHSTGFLNVLEGCRLITAPPGVCQQLQPAPTANCSSARRHRSSGQPVRSDGSQQCTYSHLFALSCTGLRFFTVYGPWGRPDMSLFLFTRAILEGRPIDVFNHGDMSRDFTYIDDIVEGVVRVMDRIPQPDPAADMLHPDPARSTAPYRIYNIGNHEPVQLTEFIGILERALGRSAQAVAAVQPGDVAALLCRPTTAATSASRPTRRWSGHRRVRDVGSSTESVTVSCARSGLDGMSFTEIAALASIIRSTFPGFPGDAWPAECRSIRWCGSMSDRRWPPRRCRVTTQCRYGGGASAGSRLAPGLTTMRLIFHRLRAQFRTLWAHHRLVQQMGLVLRQLSCWAALTVLMLIGRNASEYRPPPRH